MGVVHLKQKRAPHPPVYLRQDEKVSDIRPDYHVRSRGGKRWGYVVQDKYRKVCICSQKLELIRQHINQIVDCEPDKVSLTGLYEIMSVIGENPRSSTGGATKHRWFVNKYALEELALAFEEARAKGFEKSVVLGSTSTIDTEFG